MGSLTFPLERLRVKRLDLVHRNAEFRSNGYYDVGNSKDARVHRLTSTKVARNDRILGTCTIG